MQKQLVDLHHHLMFGMDDGAKNIEMSLQMMQRAVKNQVGKICMTVHVTPGHKPFDILQYNQNMGWIEYTIAENQLPLTVHKGCEILYTKDALRLLHEEAFPTLNNTQYVLVEFFPDTSFDEILEAVRTLGGGGYRTVIAHVERYPALAKVKNLQKIKDMYNPHIQVNASTIIKPHGFFEGRFIKKSLQRGLIDIVASDAHNVSSRPCRLLHAYKTMRHTYGEEMAQALFIDNPNEILTSV